MLTIHSVSVNSLLLPADVPCAPIRVSWKLQSDIQGTMQTAYTLCVLDEAGNTIWSSGRQEDGNSVRRACDAKLASDSAYTVSVTVEDNHGETVTASGTIHTALRPEDWKAQWIRPKRHIEGWAPYLRTRFICGREVRSASLYVSGLGCAEYTINGAKVSEDLIDPPMTNYKKEVFYRRYDVTGLLAEKNAFVAILGEGWYSQSRVWAPSAFKYGNCCLKAQLVIHYDDGSVQTVVTSDDGSWTARYSPIVLNNLYGGETYDCRLEIDDYCNYDADDDGWEKVETDPVPKGELKLCPMAPVRVIREIPAKSVKQVSGKDDGAWIIDMGENFAGFARFRLPPSPRGAQYVFRFAETINPDGSLDMRSIGSFATQCIQQDVYIARGDKNGEEWQPRFTYHAFRYIEITGYHDLRAYGTDPGLCVATGYAISTDLRQVGSFACANSDMNRLHGIMMNTFQSNYHGFPEDCPGREKCGWLGDAEVVCNTGMYNYDMEAAYTKYLHDIRTQTEVYGTWNMIAPGKRGCGEASPLWGCAQIIIPYWMYWYYGDEDVVRDNWDLMEKWVTHEFDDAKDLIITRGLGDWCPPVDDDSPRRIPVPESSTLMFHEICLRMAELADRLDMPCERNYRELAEQIRESFNRHFYLADKHRYSTWGTCGVALMTGIYPEGEKEALLKALLALMAEDDYAMPTGIYGNKYLVPALCENGHGDDAFKYLFNRKHTSFATMMDDGATSLWEALQLKGIGQPRSHGTASFNHPMHSGFAWFYYTQVAGIKPLEPGFRRFEIEPCRFTDIPYATVSYDSPYGVISVEFMHNPGSTRYTFRVPENTVCVLKAGGKCKEYAAGEYTVTVKDRSRYRLWSLECDNRP